MAEADGRQVLAVDFEYGQIVAWIRAHPGGIVGVAIVEDDRNGAGACNHMVVGHNVAITGQDKPRSGSRYQARVAKGRRDECFGIDRDDSRLADPGDLHDRQGFPGRGLAIGEVGYGKFLVSRAWFCGLGRWLDLVAGLGLFADFRTGWQGWQGKPAFEDRSLEYRKNDHAGQDRKQDGYNQKGCYQRDGAARTPAGRLWAAGRAAAISAMGIKVVRIRARL